VATGYTDEEVRAAVDKFLLRQASVSLLPNGARNVVQLRDTVYDLVTTVLLLRPDSFFYVVWQAGNKLKGLVNQQIASLDQIVANGPGVTKPAKKINSTSELTNARAALLEVNSGLNARTQGVSGSIGPAVTRFRRSINRFLQDEVTKNVVVNGAVTDTADGLKEVIRTEWSDAVERHEEIVSLATSLTSALSELSSVRLPQSAIQSIVGRIQTRLFELETVMVGSSGIAESRQAMLDLLTMRTLLTKASSFRAPALALMPLTGDSSTVTPVDSAGVEAFVVSTVSAPYNYDPGASLSLSLNGGTPVAVSLPRSSCAEIRSRTISPWTEPPGSSEILLSINGGGVSGPLVLPLVPAYGSGPAAAAAFDAGLAGVSVTWDAAASQLVFQSEDETDISKIRLSIATAPTAAFGAWFGGLLEGYPSPPTAEELVTAVASATSLVRSSIAETFYGTFSGVREALPTNVVWSKTAEGTDLASTGTTQVTSSSTNFEIKRVRPGMALEITAPPAAVGQYVVVSVSGGTLTLDAPVPAAVGATYFVGPDFRAVPAGARVQVVGAADANNRGFYRVDVGGGLVAKLPLDRALASADAALTFSVYEKTIRLTAVGTATTSGIGVTAVNPVGFAVVPETPASLTTFSLVGAGDFVFRGVRAGDRVTLTSPTSVSYTCFVTALTTSTVSVSPPVQYEPGSWTYAIQSERVLRYTALVDYPALSFPGTQPYVGEFLSSTYVTNFAALDLLVGRLLRGAVYSGQIEAALSQYEADLANLKQALDLFSVPTEKSMDNVIRTMREQGLDRAADLFLALQISEFFSMEPEGVSYSTWVTYQSARAAREVAPVSKMGRSALVYQEWRPLSFQTNTPDLVTIDRNRG
jgi:hypothetical protein